MTPDAAIVTAATWTAWLVAGYLVVGAVAAVLGRSRAGRAVGRVVGPGLAVVIATGGVAAASTAGAPHPRPPVVSVDWRGAVREPHLRVVRVEPGDCLWDIAARGLPRPSDARIAATWPRWWRTNRRVVGADPDLLHPGQRLRPPASTRSPS